MTLSGINDLRELPAPRKVEFITGKNDRGKEVGGGQENGRECGQFSCTLDTTACAHPLFLFFIWQSSIQNSRQNTPLFFLTRTLARAN